jgi:hypothetical protein
MSLPTVSTANFQAILDGALDIYVRETGVDITKHPSADKLQNCHSPEDIIQLLLERETAFKDYRDTKVWDLIDRLRPTVRVVHALSDVLGEVASLVSSEAQDCRNLIIYYAYPILGTISADESDIYRNRCSPLSTYCIFKSSPIRSSDDIYPHKAAMGVRSSYDALLDLFECVASFLNRLHIYTDKISLSPMMLDIVVKIMGEIIAVLALATKQIKQGRLSKWTTTYRAPLTKHITEKFAGKLLGESDIEAVLERLDRLTQEEAKITATNTLEVVHELFNNLKEVMNGAPSLLLGLLKRLILLV